MDEGRTRALEIDAEVASFLLKALIAAVETDRDMGHAFRAALAEELALSRDLDPERAQDVARWLASQY